MRNGGSKVNVLKGLVIGAAILIASLSAASAQQKTEQKKGDPMKSVIIYYSYSGNTAAATIAIAGELGSDVIQIEDVKKPGKFKAYIHGAFAARKEKSWPIKPLPIDISRYDRVFIGGPVWWGKQPPEVNAAIDQLSFAGKKVVVFVTLGGSSSKEALEAMARHVQLKGGIVEASFAVSTGGKSREEIVSKAKEMVQQYK
jgi:flavodoxin